MGWVGRGGVVFGPTIADRVLACLAAPGLLKPVVPFPELTERERELLHLIAQGHSNDAIARRLFLSGKTVRNHVSNIFSKLQLADRAEAIVRAREAGLASEPPRRWGHSPGPHISMHVSARGQPHSVPSPPGYR